MINRLHILIIIIECGAGKEARTPDLLLGKQSLYQLSYTRMQLFTAERRPVFQFPERGSTSGVRAVSVYEYGALKGPLCSNRRATAS